MEQIYNLYPHIGCIFIHIPKTGGTSVTKLLNTLEQQLAESGEPPKFIIPQGYSWHKHQPAHIFKNDLGSEVWDNAFKFCFIRNPFELMVSCYFWWLQKASKFPQFVQAANVVRELGSYNSFLKHELGRKYINEYIGEPEHWFLDLRCNDMVDHIIKLEQPSTLLSQLGEFNPQIRHLEINSELPLLNKTQRESYQNYYNEESIQIVSWRFRYSIYRFNYKFESSEQYKA